MLGIIGGTGLSEIDSFELLGEEAIPTPYAHATVGISLCRHAGQKLAFLPRHGKDHVLPPHKINYRANIWALHQLGVTQLVAVNAVGGIHPALGPGQFAVPDQIIDYTSGREATFHDDDEEIVRHIDFTYPYDAALRKALLGACRRHSHATNVMDGGVYACANGPRLETAAEIVKCKRDGCDMIGMTGMPEATLAREAGIAYASLALSVNWAAGIGKDPITMHEIHQVLEQGMVFVKGTLQELAEQGTA